MTHRDHDLGRLRGALSSPVRDILALTDRPGVVSFAGGLPAPELFDVAGLRRAFASVLTDASGGRALQYSTTEGNPALRRAIAERLTSRGLPSEAEDLLITSGSQQALTLVASLLLKPGDRVLVEEPSYLAALQCFALAGAIAVPVPCDDDGLDPAALDELVSRHRPKLLYTVPTFHNPTGRTLTLARRHELAALIERTDVWLVEDDLWRVALRRGTLADDRVAAGGERPDAGAVHAFQDRRTGPASRVGPRAPRAAAPADDRQAGGRSALVDDRPGRGRALADHNRPRCPYRRPARGLSRSARRPSRRPGVDPAGRLGPQPPGWRHVRLGAVARRVGRNRAAAAGA